MVGIGTVSAISFLGSLILVVVGMTVLTSDNPEAGAKPLPSGVISVVSLLLVSGHFRCLFAIHQPLTKGPSRLWPELASRFLRNSQQPVAQIAFCDAMYWISRR